MNRLRKPRQSESSPVANAANATPTSRTMQLAVSGMKVVDTSWGDRQVEVEQYWAVRALVAETMLSARDRHQDELAEMRRIEEQKREREMGAILRANDQKQRRLEGLMVTCLVVLLGFMCWLVMMIAPDRNAKHKPSKQPSRFTIPILSPFASVVEHETSVFGTKIIAILVLVMGVACYAALRRRLSQWRT